MDCRASRLSRREFVMGAGAAGLGLLAGCGRLPGQAQPPVRIPRIGYVSGSSQGANQALIDAFQQGLRDQGYVEGHNLAVEWRWGQGNDSQLAGPIAELTRLPVDLIVVTSSVLARMAREATSTLPIVVTGTGGESGVVGAGLADSLARPGGNVTGLSPIPLHPKRLELLQQGVPASRRVGVIVDTNIPRSAGSQDGALDEAAQILGVQWRKMAVASVEELESVFGGLDGDPIDVLLVMPSPFAILHGSRIGELAMRYRLPAMYPYREPVEAGGLMAYYAVRTDLARRAAYYVDRILKGAKPGDLPLEQPMRFDFLVNLKTAQALGITFPNEIMLQVTEVVQ